MDWPWLVAVIVIVLVGLLAKSAKPKRSEFFPYRVSGPLVSKAERSFLGVLDLAVGEGYRIFAKVRVADLLLPEKGLKRQEWRRAFNQVALKHFDFVLCDKGSLQPELVVELNDASHKSKKRARRDKFLARACESAELKLIWIPAKAKYSPEQLRSLIQESLEGQII